MRSGKWLHTWKAKSISSVVSVTSSSREKTASVVISSSGLYYVTFNVLNDFLCGFLVFNDECPEIMNVSVLPEAFADVLFLLWDDKMEWNAARQSRPSRRRRFGRVACPYHHNLMRDH